jgi:hypothetical protein
LVGRLAATKTNDKFPGVVQGMVMSSKAPQAELPSQEDLPPVQWRDVPTVLVDGVIGDCIVSGVRRITLAEFVYNETPGAPKPRIRTVVTLAMTDMALKNISDYLAKLVNSAADAG